ncbi:hypothetical protein FACS1894200_02680 [Spirochaetia bacterium]|nr:hypothetical protein FACS1894200_02680 [Spirochaetia bacterium]
MYAVTPTQSGTGNAVIYGSNAEGNQKRNTTARVAMAMDSTKGGPAGGWE